MVIHIILMENNKETPFGTLGLLKKSSLFKIMENDGTVKFIRTKEELNALRWK